MYNDSEMVSYSGMGLDTRRAEMVILGILVLWWVINIARCGVGMPGTIGLQCGVPVFRVLLPGEQEGHRVDNNRTALI